MWWVFILVLACQSGGRDDPSTSPAHDGASFTLTDGGAQAQALSVELRVQSRAPTAVWVVCTRDDVPDERILVETGALSTSHALVVWGLAAGATYACEAHDDDGNTAVVQVQAAPLPSVLGYEVTVPSAHGPFLTLFADLRTCASVATATDTHVVMVDHLGEARWLLPVPEALPSIDLDVRTLRDGTVHMGGGWGTAAANIPHRGIFRTVDLAGTVLVDRPQVGFGLGFNHHSEQLADGTFATLSFDPITDGSTTQLGTALEHWDPVTDTVVHTWSSQQLIDGGLAFGDGPNVGVWTANSFSYLTDPVGEALYVSVVTNDEIWRIDPATGELTHRIGPHGGWALRSAEGALLEQDDWFFFQHDPEFTPDGRVLLHDNGSTRSLFGGLQSRVVELQLDLAAEEATVLWEWTEPRWFNRFVGDADRLSDGTVSITQGYFECFSGPNGHSSIVQVDPATDEVVYRLDWTSSSFAPYRSEQVPLCDWLPNAAFCPEVGARIDALTSGAVSPGQ